MRILGAPRQAEQFILEQALEDHLQRHLFHQARSPGGRARDGWRRRHSRTLRNSHILLCFGRPAQLALRLLVQIGKQRAARLYIDQRIHRRKPFEGILAVKYARFVRSAVLGKQDAPAKAAVNSRPAYQHRVFQPAALQFVHDQRHLLAGIDQQGAQADGSRIDFHRFGDDDLSRHLLAQVDHGIAIIRQDRLDQVFANIMHIAVDRRHHHRPLGGALGALQELLDVRDGFLHDFGRLQHKGQN